MSKRNRPQKLGDKVFDGSPLYYYKGNDSSSHLDMLKLHRLRSKRKKSNKLSKLSRQVNRR